VARALNNGSASARRTYPCSTAALGCATIGRSQQRPYARLRLSIQADCVVLTRGSGARQAAPLRANARADPSSRPFAFEKTPTRFLESPPCLWKGTHPIPRVAALPLERHLPDSSSSPEGAYREDSLHRFGLAAV